MEQDHWWTTLLVISFHSPLILFFNFFFYLFILLLLIGLNFTMHKHLVRNSKGILETSETFFGSLFDIPIHSPTSSIMAEERERTINPEAPRRTMYKLLHPT